MPCQNAKLVPATTGEHEEDSITICYTVCPHRGGFSEVYQLTHKSDTSGPILRSAYPHRVEMTIVIPTINIQSEVRSR